MSVIFLLVVGCIVALPVLAWTIHAKRNKLSPTNSMTWWLGFWINFFFGLELTQLVQIGQFMQFTERMGFWSMVELVTIAAVAIFVGCVAKLVFGFGGMSNFSAIVYFLISVLSGFLIVALSAAMSWIMGERVRKKMTDKALDEYFGADLRQKFIQAAKANGLDPQLALSMLMKAYIDGDVEISSGSVMVNEETPIRVHSIWATLGAGAIASGDIEI